MCKFKKIARGRERSQHARVGRDRPAEISRDRRDFRHGRSLAVLGMGAAGELGQRRVALVLQVFVDADSRRVVAVDRGALEDREEAFERIGRSALVAGHLGDDGVLLLGVAGSEVGLEALLRELFDRRQAVLPLVLDRR